MWERKSINKSIRITPLINEFILNFEGNGYNDKINNMFNRFIVEMPELEEKKLKLEQEIEDLVLDKQKKIDEFWEIQKKVQNSLNEIKKSLEF